MFRRLLFLDIDGVLGNRKSMNASNEGIHPPGPLGMCFTVDPDCVARLRKIVEELDIQLVISSTWRHHTAAIVRAFEWCGWYDAPILGGTSLVYAPRGQQIADWLKQYGKSTDVWAIVDDDTQDIHQKDRLVRTEHELGLTDDDVIALRNLFAV